MLAKSHLTAFLTVISIAVVAAQRVNPDPVRFSDLDVSARREAMHAVEKAVQSQAPDGNALKLTEAGLGDTDSVVRMLAAGSLSHILHPVGPAMAAANATIAAVKGLSSVKKHCVKNLDDPDFSVRGVCTDALLTLAPPLSADVREALVSLYHREENKQVRVTLVSGLSIKGTDHDDVRQLVVAALDDPYNPVRRAAVRGIAKFQPADALPKIVAELQSGPAEPRPGEAFIRDDFIEALASYGSRAKPYVTLLENLLVNETRANQTAHLRQAIEKIRNSKP